MTLRKSPTYSNTPTCLSSTWKFISYPTPLTAQFIEGARHSDFVEIHLHVEHSEDGQQLREPNLVSCSRSNLTMVSLVRLQWEAT
jgi:hypothetical protein